MFDVSWFTPGSIEASILASSGLGFIWFCPGSASVSTLAPPSGFGVAGDVAWAATVNVVVAEGGCCDVESVARDGRDASDAELLAVPLIGFSVSSDCLSDLPSPPTRPSLPF